MLWLVKKLRTEEALSENTFFSGGLPHPHSLPVRQHENQQAVFRYIALLWQWTKQFLWFLPAVAGTALLYKKDSHSKLVLLF